MAKIVLGLGTSHTPMLLASDETLPRFVETDQKIKHRDKEGRPVTYGELLEKASRVVEMLLSAIRPSTIRQMVMPRTSTLVPVGGRPS